MTKQLSKADLAQFSGTEEWYRHWMVRQVLYTEGVKYVADVGGAHWLVDAIAFEQSTNANVAAEEFQLWKLIVTDSRAVLVCEDGNGNTVLTKSIPFTDFPLPEISFYYRDNVLMLPSEY